jgi:hypothetical protein
MAGIDDQQEEVVMVDQAGRLVKAEFVARHRDQAEARQIAQLRVYHEPVVRRVLQIDLRNRAPVDFVARRDPFTGAEGFGREVTQWGSGFGRHLSPCFHKRGARILCPILLERVRREAITRPDR